MRLVITPTQVERLEKDIDALNANLSPLKSFVLTGGMPAAAHLHVARTVCRRAERVLVSLGEKKGEELSPTAFAYVNRLSDFLFVASRYVNRDRGDVLWQPGATR